MSKSFNDNHLQNNTMTLTGQGQVTSDPDIAIIRLGVQTTGDNLVDTQSENAQISQSILQALRQYDISDITTYQYNIEKIYDYENGTRIDKGYSVRNILEIKLDNINEVGMVIDTSVNNGANVVEFISFEISNPDIYYQEALNLAVMNTLEKAKAISMFLGLSLDPIPIRIIENSTSPTPFSQIYAGSERNFATPIEPGQKQINALVTVKFIY